MKADIVAGLAGAAGACVTFVGCTAAVLGWLLHTARRDQRR
jgi:hypothetical protein